VAKYASEDIVCTVMGSNGAEHHHLVSRGAGGTDDPHNMIPLCSALHRMAHSKGLRYMADKFPAIRVWLKEHDWEFCPVMLKWRHNERKK
jgi:hypothetical protein